MFIYLILCILKEKVIAHRTRQFWVERRNTPLKNEFVKRGIMQNISFNIETKTYLENVISIFRKEVASVPTRHGPRVTHGKKIINKYEMRE